MGLRFLLLTTMFWLSSCATNTPKDASWEKLWSYIRLEGEGRARLEIPPESWVFSFESVMNKNGWLMAISIPMKGDESFAFPGLDQSRPEITPAGDDFRWQIIQALREASHRRRLSYPQLGNEFVNSLHHLLRWTHADMLGLKRKCVALTSTSWACKWDGISSSWSWDERKKEFVGELQLREHWLMRSTFKNLTDSVFKRVTLEINRNTGDAQVTELRQEFFFH